MGVSLRNIKEKGEFELDYTSSSLKMKFIYSSADGTKPSQVWFSLWVRRSDFSAAAAA